MNPACHATYVTGCVVPTCCENSLWVEQSQVGRRKCKKPWRNEGTVVVVSLGPHLEPHAPSSLLFRWWEQQSNGHTRHTLREGTIINIPKKKKWSHFILFSRRQRTFLSAWVSGNTDYSDACHQSSRRQSSSWANSLAMLATNGMGSIDNAILLSSMDGKFTF